MADDRLTHDPSGTSPGARAMPEPPTADTKRLYQAEAVDRYIATVHAEIDELRRQLDEALRIAEAAGGRAATAEDAQARLGRTLLSTQRAADAAVGDAEKQARGIVAAANLEADALLAEVRAQAQEVINEAHVAVEVLIEAMRRPAPGDVVPDLDLAEAVPTGLILTLRPSDGGTPPLTGRRLA
jgi:cell division septum initiation protein DivIVA